MSAQCNLIKGITPKMRMLCFVQINSVIQVEPVVQLITETDIARENSAGLCEQNPHSLGRLTLLGSRQVSLRTKLQALVYDILPLEEGAGKRCSECVAVPRHCTRTDGSAAEPVVRVT